MMSLIFFLYLAAMVLALVRRRQQAVACFVVALIVSLFWFRHHATDALDILL
ncbi:MAG: DUF5993 family protein [Pseudomonadota bacterium]